MLIFIVMYLNGVKKQFDKNNFDFIRSSPPCTEYSKAKPTGKRNI